MGIYDSARALGKEIVESEAAKKLEEARKAFDNSEKSQKLVNEYTELKQKFTNIMSDKDSDKIQLTDIGNKIKEIEAEVRKDEITNNLIKAESEYGAFINSVFNIINATIQGENTAGCEGQCSKCTGCC